MQSTSTFPTMNELTTAPRSPGPVVSVQSSSERILELEVENLRLQRLVLELLVKNQELRCAPDVPASLERRPQGRLSRMEPILL